MYSESGFYVSLSVAFLATGAFLIMGGFLLFLSSEGKIGKRILLRELAIIAGLSLLFFVLIYLADVYYVYPLLVPKFAWEPTILFSEGILLTIFGCSVVLLCGDTYFIGRYFVYRMVSLGRAKKDESVWLRRYAELNDLRISFAILAIGIVLVYMSFSTELGSSI